MHNTITESTTHEGLFVATNQFGNFSLSRINLSGPPAETMGTLVKDEQALCRLVAEAITGVARDRDYRALATFDGAPEMVSPGILKLRLEGIAKAVGFDLNEIVSTGAVLRDSVSTSNLKVVEYRGEDHIVAPRVYAPSVSYCTVILYHTSLTAQDDDMNLPVLASQKDKILASHWAIASVQAFAEGDPTVAPVSPLRMVHNMSAGKEFSREDAQESLDYDKKYVTLYGDAPIPEVREGHWIPRPRFS